MNIFHYPLFMNLGTYFAKILENISGWPEIPLRKEKLTYKIWFHLISFHPLYTQII